MNKILLIVCLLPLLFKESFSETITININGNVVERSCTISNSSQNQVINLYSGDLRNSELGVPFTGKLFSIILEDCPINIISAHLKFTGESDNEMKNLLKNTNESDSGAKGVAIGLYDINRKNIDITNNSEFLKIDHSEDQNTFNFYAYYVKTNETSKAGKLISIINFELSYD